MRNKLENYIREFDGLARGHNLCFNQVLRLKIEKFLEKTKYLPKVKQYLWEVEFVLENEIPLKIPLPYPKGYEKKCLKHNKRCLFTEQTWIDKV